jgi:hypothetical protein
VKGSISIWVVSGVASHSYKAICKTDNNIEKVLVNKKRER